MNVHISMGENRVVLTSPVDNTVKRGNTYDIWAKKGKSLLFDAATGLAVGVKPEAAE